MIRKRGRHSLFVAMLATVPCPPIFLFCNGLLPVSGLGLGFVKFVAVASRDPVALVFAIVVLCTSSSTSFACTGSPRSFLVSGLYAFLSSEARAPGPHRRLVLWRRTQSASA